MKGRAGQFAIRTQSPDGIEGWAATSTVCTPTKSHRGIWQIRHGAYAALRILRAAFPGWLFVVVRLVPRRAQAQAQRAAA